jgi:RNA polymerase sigma factor (sigma-70 family)
VTPERDALVLAALPRVQLLGRLLYNSMNRLYALREEDLVSEGYLGLVEAAQRYDLGHRSCFWTFAKLRVLGAMKDLLRRQYPVCGVGRYRKNKVHAVQLSVFLDHEVDRIAIVPEPDYGHCLVRACIGRRVRDPRARRILLAELDGITQQETAGQLGLSPSRACQLRRAAFNELRQGVTP